MSLSASQSAATAIAAIFILCARPADACICVEDPSQWNRFTIPADGDTSVPTDALFWARDQRFGPDTARVVEELSGAEVDGVWSPLNLDHVDLHVFTPDRGWEPDTTYSVRGYGVNPDAYEEEYGAEAVPNREVQFRTADSPWDGRVGSLSPSFEIEHIGPSEGTSCDRSADHQIVVRVSMPHNGVLLVADRSDAGEFSPSTDPFRHYSHGTTRDEFTIGTTSCDADWPEAEPGSETSLKLGVFDIAGNLYLSDEIVDIKIPRSDEPQAADSDLDGEPAPMPGGCSAGSQPLNGMDFIALAAFLLLVNRRRSYPPRGNLF